MQVAVKTLGDLVQGRPLLTVHEEDTVQEAARRMHEHQMGAVLVVRETRLQGILTERDLLRRVVAPGLDPRAVRVRDVMTRQVVVGRPDESYQQGLEKMVAIDCRHLPVVQGERCVGVVSWRELMTLDHHVVEEMLEMAEPASLFI